MSGHRHRQPSAQRSALPLAPPTSSMVLERAIQHEIQIRDDHIRELQLENMRLQVRLEQAEKDVMSATEMIMVACRAGAGTYQPVAVASETIVPTGLEDLKTKPEHYTKSPAGSEVRTKVPAASKFCDVQDSRFCRGFDRSSDDVFGPSNRGWAMGDPRKKVSNLTATSRGMSEPTTIKDEWETMTKAKQTPRNEVTTGWASAFRLKSPVSLLDLDAGIVKPMEHADGYRTPSPVLLPLSPFETTERLEVVGTNATIVPRGFKPPFRHLFRPDTDITGKQQTETRGDPSSILQPFPNFNSKSPDVGFRNRANVADVHAAEEPSTAATSRATSTERISPTLHDNHNARNKKAAAEHRSNKIQSLSSDSNPTSSFESIPKLHHVHRAHRRMAHNFDHQAYRFNANKPAPWTVEDVRYTPAQGVCNYIRTVMVYNLPPQVDVAEIVARAGDEPLLSIKLLPTMGMKGKDQYGTPTSLPTMTAMMVFALDASAAQFVFDLAVEPLVIRGLRAIPKILNTPTYPSCLYTGAYTVAPGRILSRRIRFHQPSLISADEFDDALAGRSYGFNQPGWIVDKTMKKEAGKNIITVEFASVDVARFAFDQMLSLADFQDCGPRWVYDHEIDAGTGHRERLKTRDDDDSSDG